MNTNALKAERCSEGQKEAIERLSLQLGVRKRILVQICRKISGRSQLDSIAQLTPMEARLVMAEMRAGAAS